VYNDGSIVGLLIDYKRSVITINTVQSDGTLINDPDIVFNISSDGTSLTILNNGASDKEVFVNISFF